MGVEVIDRCNLTILNEPEQEDLADFLAQQKVRWWPRFLAPKKLALTVNGDVAF